MKNNRIIKAYDSINPSEAEKQRMLDAILREAKLEETPRKQEKKKKEPMVYTAKPTRTTRRSLIGPLAACFAGLLLAGTFFGFLLGQEPVEPVYEEPSSHLTDPTETIPETEESVYGEILEKYRRALDQGWDRTMCSENGLSFLTPIESEYEGLYYAISDLDGNGIEELVITEFSDTDLTSFIEIYTVANGQVTNIMSSGDTDIRFLCQGGYVKDCTPPERGGYDAYVSFWHLEEDRFTQTGHVYSIDGQWYHGLRADEKITVDEANAELESYKPLNLNYSSIQDAVPVEYLTGYAAYDSIVDKYRNALTIGFTREQCENSDISPAILDETTLKSDLGWCLLDLDGNGVEELIVSDGVYLFDLYVMMPHNGGPGHLIMSNVPSDHYMLCMDGTIEHRSNFSKGASWKYYRLSGMDLNLENILIYRNEYEGTEAAEMYYYGTDEENVQPISKDEAGNLLVSTKRSAMELNLTPFVEQAPFDPDEAEYYAPLLERYRQAIREAWNPGTCVENGISLMVGYYGDFVEELGYASLDLDSNGIDELIITDGTNIYDLYTIIQDEEVGPLRLIDAMERIEYFLLDDGRIYCMGSGSASVSYYTFYQLEGRELSVLEGYMTDYETNPDAPWYYYNGVEKGGSCSRETAASAIDPVQFAHIPFTPFE